MSLREDGTWLKPACRRSCASSCLQHRFLELHLYEHAASLDGCVLPSFAKSHILGLHSISFMRTSGRSSTVRMLFTWTYRRVRCFTHTCSPRWSSFVVPLHRDSYGNSFIWSYCTSSWKQSNARASAIGVTFLSCGRYSLPQ